MVINVASDMEFTLRESNIIANKKNAVVLFCADWCSSCKSLANLIEEQSEETLTYDWLKVNIANTPNIIKKYGIKSLPSLLIFKQGILCNRINSNISKTDLIRNLDLSKGVEQ